MLNDFVFTLLQELQAQEISSLKWRVLIVQKSEEVWSVFVVGVICSDSITCNGEMNYVKIVLLAKIGMWFDNFHFFVVLTEIIVWKLKLGLSLIRT